MGLSNFRQLSDDEVAILFKKNSRAIAIHYTPEEKLENILKKLRSKNVSTRKFHFKLIEGDENLHLYSGDRKALGLFEKSNQGIVDARALSRNLFCAERRELKQGGYKLDLVIDNRQIDLTMGFDDYSEEVETISHSSNSEFKRLKMSLIDLVESRHNEESLEIKISVIEGSSFSSEVKKAAIEYFS